MGLSMTDDRPYKAAAPTDLREVDPRRAPIDATVKEQHVVLTRVLIRKPADAVTLLDMLGIIPGEAKA